MGIFWPSGRFFVWGVCRMIFWGGREGRLGGTGFGSGGVGGMYLDDGDGGLGEVDWRESFLL